MNMEKFIEQIKEGVKEEGKRFEILEKYRLPEDFKIDERFEEGNYLKIVILKILS